MLELSELLLLVDSRNGCEGHAFSWPGRKSILEQQSKSPSPNESRIEARGYGKSETGRDGDEYDGDS
jgi:hypothetical protein